MSYNPFSASPQRPLHPEISNPFHANKKKQEVAHDLEAALQNTSDVLLKVTAVFPLTMFPDTVTMNRTNLTITHRTFFKVSEVLSISIDDILNVTASVGPFFGSIKITTRFFSPDKPYDVDNFKREDALRIKRVVQGYIIAKQNDIDCSDLTTKELSTLLNNLGKDGT